jgi:hypothetical protein
MDTKVRAKSSTGSAWPSIGADELHAVEPQRVIPGRNRTKADVLVYALNGLELAVKDYGRRPLLVRQTLGRFLIRREAAAYRAAEGVRGLPRFFGCPTPFALVTQWIQGRTLSSYGNSAPPLSCFDQIERTLNELHARGVALGDLHHRDVLISDDGAVHLIDLATAWVIGPRRGYLRRLLFRRFRDQDLVALVRMRARYSGGDPDRAVAELGGAAAAWHRRGRRFKRSWDRLRGRRR